MWFKKDDKRHRYSTIFLGILLIAIVIVAVESLDSSEVDEICSQDDKIIKRISGLWQCADDETGSGGGTSDHSQLTNLTWSTAGHTIDTTFDLNNQDIANPGAGHDLYTDYVANEHIDWTSTNQNLVTTGKVTTARFESSGSEGSVIMPDLAIAPLEVHNSNSNNYWTAAFYNDVCDPNNFQFTYYGFNSCDFAMGTEKNSDLIFYTNGYANERWVMQNDGDLVPRGNGTYDMGQAANRIGDLYAAGNLSTPDANIGGNATHTIINTQGKGWCIGNC